MGHISDEGAIIKNKMYIIVSRKLVEIIIRQQRPCRWRTKKCFHSRLAKRIIDMAQKVVLKQISPKSWEHPADKAALEALKRVPGLDKVIQTFVGNTTERSLRLLYLATSIRVSEKQFNRVHRIGHEVFRIFDTPYSPEIYITQSYSFNAMAVGVEKPFIVLHSSLVESMDDQELGGVIAHELGHILSGHVLYKTLLWVLLNLSQFLLQIPIGGAVLGGVIMALREWDRKSELSSDRAGLLYTQNPDVSSQILMKLAGGNNLEELNLGEFLKQAQEYSDSSNSFIDNLYKFLNVMNQSHPFASIRAMELINWVRSGNYDSILNGTYEHQTGDFFQDLKKSAESYRKEFSDTVNPLHQNINEASQKAKDIFDALWSRYR